MSRLRLKRFKAVEPPPEVAQHFIRDYRPKDLYLNFDDQPPITSAGLFTNERPLVLDLGCGRGDFIVAEAAANPAYNFIGFDYHLKSLWDAISKVQAAELANVRFVRGDFRRLLPLIPDGVAAAIYLLFPPPVLARKRLKNDTLTGETLREYHRILMADAPLHFVTDREAYYVLKREMVGASGLFRIVNLSQEIEGGITWFQRHWEQYDILSNRLECRKIAGASVSQPPVDRSPATPDDDSKIG